MDRLAVLIRVTWTSGLTAHVSPVPMALVKVHAQILSAGSNRDGHACFRSAGISFETAIARIAPAPDSFYLECAFAYLRASIRGETVYGSQPAEYSRTPGRNNQAIAEVRFCQADLTRQQTRQTRQRGSCADGQYAHSPNLRKR